MLQRHIGILLILLGISSLAATSASPIDELMIKLIEAIGKEQVLQTKEFKIPVDWKQVKGLYRSEIRFNVFGKWPITELRNNRLTYVFDNNMFATGWIITTLLEANMYGRVAQTINEEQLLLALQTIESFHDNNQKESNVPLMTFWPQQFNTSTQTWSSFPENVVNLINHVDDFLIYVEKFCTSLHIEKCAEGLKRGIMEFQRFLKAFRIPPDFDDTYLNIGLGATLKLFADKYPSAYSLWLQKNSNMKALVELTTRYVYRPSSADVDQNIIDPRTYYWMREFLHENQQAVIITTWAQNITELKQQAQLGVAMPFNVNNIDVTVGANVLYGITSAVLNDLPNFKENFNEDMQNLYKYTGSLIAWSIKHGMQGRPDLAQVYYPSNYNFLWYGSRTLFLLERARREQKKMPDVFTDVYTRLSDAYRTDVVSFLQKHVRSDSASYDDFLGINDTTLFENPSPSGEDRIFSTSQAVNVLIASFTYFNTNTGTLKWISNGNNIDTIKLMISKSVTWLVENAFSLKAYNCFFSGSIKGYKELPFYFPANFYQFVNGTSFDPDDCPINSSSIDDAVIGIQGYIDESTYKNMIAQQHCGQQTPTIFNGYNVHDSPFPFWSSQPYTYATTLLALAQYNNLDEKIEVVKSHLKLEPKFDL